jgi:ABC-type sugar transport system substrate-binding protein
MFVRRPAGLGAFVTLTSAALLLSACGGGSSSVAAGGPSGDAGAGTATSRTITVNMYSRGLPYFQDIAAGAEAEAKKLGWQVELVWGKTDPQLQFNQIQNSTQKKPDGMIVAPVDQEALIPAFEQAKAANVEIVTVADDVAEKGHATELAFAGIEYVALGKKKAQWVVDKLGGKGTVAVIHGIRGLHFSEAQWEGAKSVFDASPGITLVNGPYAGEFSADAGLKAAENVLTANPKVNALYFDNDDIALGGILAAKARKISMTDIVIIGTDGGKPARDAVKAGDLDYTISLCGYATGRIAVNIIKDKLDGGKTPSQHIVPTPFLEFTPDTVDANNVKVDNKEC